MLVVYTTPQGFRADAPKAGSKQAATRPLTLSAETITKHTVTSAVFAEWSAAETPEQAAAILAEKASNRTDLTGGRVQVTTEGLADFRQRVADAVETIHADEIAAFDPKADKEVPDVETLRVNLRAAYALDMLRRGVFVIDSGATSDDTEAVVRGLFG